MKKRNTQALVSHATALMAVLGSAHASGCSFPVHFTQSPHILVYSQQYTLCSDSDDIRKQLINSVFGTNPRYAPRRKDIEHYLIRGSMSYDVESIPGDISSFVIEGHGWHVVYYGRTGDDDTYRFIGSADYRIKDDGPFSFSDLERGSLTLRVFVVSSPSFAYPLQGTTEIFLRVFIKRIAANVYAIDHDREHDVGWRVASNGPRRFVQVIGHMQVMGRSDGQDLFDARHVRLIATDYSTLIAGRLDGPHRPADAPIVEWLPERPCEHRPIEIRS